MASLVNRRPGGAFQVWWEVMSGMRQQRTLLQLTAHGSCSLSKNDILVEKLMNVHVIAAAESEPSASLAAQGSRRPWRYRDGGIGSQESVMS